MNLVKGNLWDELGEANLLFFTANSTLNSKGELVMGAGSALEAKKIDPTLPQKVGRYVRAVNAVGGYFGIWIPAAAWKAPKEDSPTCSVIGAFQTKTDWRSPSSLEVIAGSVEALYDACQRMYWINRVAMPFPGVGHGGLRREDVLPILECLPDSVWVYEKS